MSVSNGQVANATTFNNAFASKTANNTLVGVQSLTNIANPSIADVQFCIGLLFDVVGTYETDPAPSDYLNQHYIANGDGLKVAIAKLDAQLNTTQTQVSGHETRLTNIESNAFTFNGNKTFANDVTVNGNLTVHGTTTTIDSTNLTVTDQNITVNNGGNDASAETAGLTVVRTTTNAAFQFDSSLSSKWKLGLVGSLFEIIVSGVAQTVSGLKDFVNGIKTDTITESTTSAGVTVAGVLIQAGSINKSVVGLSNVTNDAQLKRVAGDFSTFTQKTTPTGNDVFLIEDSSAAGAKKYIKYSDLGTGGSSLSIITKTANYTAAINDGLILCDASGGAFTITLPTAVGNTGKTLSFKSISSALFNQVTIDGAGTETIDGYLTKKIVSKGDFLTIASDGASWVSIEENIAVIASYRFSVDHAFTTGNPLNFDAKLQDTHSLVTTGSGWRFTAEESGFYEVSGVFYPGTPTDISVYLNGGSYIFTFNSSGPPNTIAPFTIPLSANEYIDLRPDTNGTSAGASSWNFINIKKVGNF